MSLLQKRLAQNRGHSPLALLVGEIKNLMQGSSVSTQAIARNSMSTGMESLSEMDASAVNHACDQLNASLESIASKMNISKNLTQAQKDSATIAGLMSGDAQYFLGQESAFAGAGAGFAVVDGVVPSNEVFSKRTTGLEAFDDRDNRNLSTTMVTYNLLAARQDEFGEALFPTVTVSPDNLGLNITTRIVNVMNEASRSITGNATAFNKRNILDAVVDATILHNESTRLIPVYRAQNADKFVDSAVITPSTLALEGESIPTSALAVSKNIELLAISQTDALLASGVAGVTDSIDPGVQLQSVYAKIGNDVLRFRVLDFPMSTFTPAAQGQKPAMTLQFNTTSVLLKADTLRLDGSALTTLAGIVTGDLMVRVGFNVGGQLNTETGIVNIYPSGLTVESVTDSTGAQLSLSAAPALAIVTAITGGAVIGYDLKAYRSNLNLRQRGQLMDVTYINQTYPVLLRAPVSVLRPVSSDASTDSSDLAALIQSTHIRTSNAAVTALLSAADTLTNYVDARDTAGVGPDVLGVGRYLVRPTYMSDVVDVATDIDSLTSLQRFADIQALLVNKIRDIAYSLYTDSRYKAAADARAGGISSAPTVIVATDPYLARYIMTDGDLRTLGGEFGVQVVSTLDSRMRGMIAVTFASGAATGNVDPLTFGAMAWKPEIPMVVPVSRDGQVSKQLTVQPAFLHFVNLPVLGMIRVSNIPAIVSNKVTINMHSVV
jgi:hypothetical protein